MSTTMIIGVGMIIEEAMATREVLIITGEMATTDGVMITDAGRAERKRGTLAGAWKNKKRKKKH